MRWLLIFIVATLTMSAADAERMSFKIEPPSQRKPPPRHVDPPVVSEQPASMSKPSGPTNMLPPDFGTARYNAKPRAEPDADRDLSEPISFGTRQPKQR